MKVRWFNLAGLAAAIAACGSGGGGGGGDDSDDDVDPVDARRGGVDAGGDAGPVWPDPPPLCRPTCTQPADCGYGPVGSNTDADNFACVDDACFWRGCNTTAECTMLLGDPDTTCEAAFGSTEPTCWETCTTDADCPHGSSPPAVDGDNYVCDGGKCRYTGCNSTEECRQTNPLYAMCAVRGGIPRPECWRGCTAASDCALSGDDYDADNFTCEDGACVHTGCNATSECAGTTVCAPWPF